MNSEVELPRVLRPAWIAAVLTAACGATSTCDAYALGREYFAQSLRPGIRDCASPRRLARGQLRLRAQRWRDDHERDVSRRAHRRRDRRRAGEGAATRRLRVHARPLDGVVRSFRHLVE